MAKITENQLQSHTPNTDFISLSSATLFINNLTQVVCVYNNRKTKNCKVTPKHEFKELKLCDPAKGSWEYPMCGEHMAKP